MKHLGNEKQKPKKHCQIYVSIAVDLGATVIFGETTEFIGGEHLLAKRAVGGEDGPVGQKIYQIVDAMESRAKTIGCDMRKGQP